MRISTSRRTRRLGINVNDVCWYKTGVTGGVGPFNYKWYVDNSLVSTDTIYVKSPSHGAGYTLRLEVAETAAPATTQVRSLEVTTFEGGLSACIGQEI